MSKRIVIMSDLHCGHRVGLTPPNYQYRDGDLRLLPFAVIQRELWNWAKAKMKDLQPIHTLCCVGDLVDGKGEASGSTEQITTDAQEQARWAAEFIKMAKPKNVLINYGTSFHTGKDTDYEEIVADLVDAKEIKSQIFVNINGKTFDLKHHVASGNLPHTKYTAIAREKLQNDAWNLYDERQPQSDLLFRGHGHAYAFCGDSRFLGVKLPAMSGYGSKYGERRCSQVVDVGFFEVNIDNGGRYSWEPHLLVAEFLKAEVLKL